MTPRKRSLFLPLSAAIFLCGGLVLYFFVRSDAAPSVMANRLEGESLVTESTSAGGAVKSTREEAVSFHAPGTDAQSEVLRREVHRGVVELTLTKRINGICLSQPEVLVIDPLLSTPLDLRPGVSISVDAYPARKLRLESADPAWVLEGTELSLEATTKGAIEIPVRPRHRLLLELSEHGTANWISTARAQVHWEHSAGASRRASSVFQISSENGAYIFEAPPLSQGRIRIEAATDRHRLQSSDWITLGSAEWIDFELTLLALERSTAEISVAVVKDGGEAVPGAWVTVFEEFPSCPIGGLEVSPRGLIPLRECVLDPDLLETSPTTKTLPDGTAGFRLKAPANYRVAAWTQGLGEVMSDVLHFESGETQNLVLAFPVGATLEGRVVGQLDSFASDVVKRLGGLWLENLETGVNRSASRQRKGSFRFEGLAAGDYLLHVGGIVDGWNGNENVINLLTREVEMLEGQSQWMTIELGAPGVGVTGHVEFDIEPDRWSFLVALASMPDEGYPEAELGFRPHAEKVIAANKLGQFAFFGLNEGRYRIIAEGRRKDGRAAAFLHHELDLREGEFSTRVIKLSPKGSPLRLMLVDPDTASRDITIRVAAQDPLLRYLVEDAAPVLVGQDQPSVYYGLPPGRVTLVAGGEDLKVEVERGSTVLIPAGSRN